MDGIGVVAVVVGVVITAVSVTGNSKALCDALGGTYTPPVTANAEVCPGGHWANLFKPSKPATK